MRRMGKARRARGSAEEWAALFAEQAASGLSQRAFCEARQLSASTFSNAKRRIDRGVRSVPKDVVAGGEFIEVAVGAEPLEQRAPRWEVELALGADVVLRVRRV